MTPDQDTTLARLQGLLEDAALCVDTLIESTFYPSRLTSVLDLRIAECAMWAEKLGNAQGGASDHD